MVKDMRSKDEPLHRLRWRNRTLASPIEAYRNTQIFVPFLQGQTEKVEAAGNVRAKEILELD